MILTLLEFLLSLAHQLLVAVREVVSRAATTGVEVLGVIARDVANYLLITLLVLLLLAIALLSLWFRWRRPVRRDADQPRQTVAPTSN